MFKYLASVHYHLVVRSVHNLFVGVLPVDGCCPDRVHKVLQQTGHRGVGGKRIPGLSEGRRNGCASAIGKITQTNSRVLK